MTKTKDQVMFEMHTDILKLIELVSKSSPNPLLVQDVDEFWDSFHEVRSRYIEDEDED